MALTMCKPILPVSASSTPYEAWANGYNDSRFNRWKTLSQIAVSRHMPTRRHSNSSILYLSPTTLVKYGRTVHLSEASALLFLASFAPDVPIPRLHCAFRDDEKRVTYIVMERIDGQPLSDSWHEASRDEKDRLLTQLRNILEELRALKKPAGKGIPDGAVISGAFAVGFDFVCLVKRLTGGTGVDTESELSAGTFAAADIRVTDALLAFSRDLRSALAPSAISG